MVPFHRGGSNTTVIGPRSLGECVLMVQVNAASERPDLFLSLGPSDK